MITLAQIRRYENRPADSFPSTRRELLYWLWKQGESAFNIFKEGPHYAVTVKGRNGKAFICATGVRCIDSLTFSDWRGLLADKKWETT